MVKVEGKSRMLATESVWPGCKVDHKREKTVSVDNEEIIIITRSFPIQGITMASIQQHKKVSSAKK